MMVQAQGAARARRRRVLTVASVVVVSLAGLVSYQTARGENSAAAPDNSLYRSVTPPPPLTPSAQRRADAAARLTDPLGNSALLVDARTDVEGLLSYDDRSLPAFAARIQALAAGAYRDRLAAVAAARLAASSTRDQLKRTASVRDIGVGSVRDDRAEVLAFVHETSSSATITRATDTWVAVSLLQIGGRWHVTGLRERGAVTGPLPGTPGLARTADVAGEVALTITTLSPTTVDAQLAHLAAMSTPASRADIGALARAVAQPVLDQGERTIGRVVTTGVTQATGDSATLLVVVRRQSDGGGGARTRDLRLKILIAQYRSTWMVSDLTVVG